MRELWKQIEVETNSHTQEFSVKILSNHICILRVLILDTEKIM